MAEHGNRANSGNIGLVIHHTEFFGRSAFSDTNRGVSMLLDKTGYHSLLIPFKNQQSDARHKAFLLTLAYEKKLEGYLITASQVPEPELANLEKQDVPFVLLNCFVPDKAFSFVCPDYHKCTYFLTEHLLKQGYQTVVYFGGYGERFPIEKERLNGYRQALRDAGKEPQKDWEIFLPFEEREKIQRRFADLDAVVKPSLKKREPVGILCGDDLMAAEVINHIKEEGFAIPDEVGIAGEGNFAFSESLAPALTTVDLFKTEMGKVGAEILVRKLKGDRDTSHIFLKPELLIRDSSRRQK